MRHLLIILILGQTNGWVGQRVFTKYGTVLRVGSTVVDDANRTENLAVSRLDRQSFRVYRVERTNGPWLWLNSEAEGVSGWARAEQVIPHDQAIDYYTAQIRERPTTAFYNTRGIIWGEKGEFDIAIADFNEAIRLDPRDEVAYNNRGMAWRAKQDYDKAIADFNEAIRLDPEYTSAHINRGNVWRDTRHYDHALADYDEAIRLAPSAPDGYNARAWLRATCPDASYRDAKKAFADASRAYQLAGEKSAFKHGTLAAAYAESGDFTSAVKSQERAQELYMRESDRKKGLARLELYRARKPYRDEPEIK